MITVKILNSGWPGRNPLAAVTVRRAEFVKVADGNDIPAYPMLSSPALAINKKRVCSGRIPKQSEVAAWLTTGQSGEQP